MIPSFVLMAIFVIPHPLGHTVDQSLHGFMDALEQLHVFHIPEIHILHIGGIEMGHESEISALNIRTILAFTGFFGGIGWVSKYYGASDALAITIAVASGVIAFYLAWKFTLLVEGGTGSTYILTEELIGQIATVIVAVNPNKIGEVSLTVRDRTVRLLVRSNESEIIPRGATVQITKRSDEGREYIVQPDTA